MSELNWPQSSLIISKGKRDKLPGISGQLGIIMNCLKSMFRKIENHFIFMESSVCCEYIESPEIS